MYKNSWNQSDSKNYTTYAANDTDAANDVNSMNGMNADMPMTLPSYPDTDSSVNDSQDRAPASNKPATLPSYPDTDPSLGGPAFSPNRPSVNDTPVTLPSYPDTDPSLGGSVPSGGSPGINFPVTLPSFPDIPVASPFPPSYPSVPVTRGCNIRILHADRRVGAVNVILSGVTLVTNLTYGSVSAYSQESSGTLLVTVVSSNNVYQYIVQETMRFNSGETYTIAIIPNGNATALFQITDVSCSKSLYNSCLRAINLSTGGGPLDISLLDGRTIARNLSFKGIGSYRQFTPGTYRVLVYENKCSNNSNPIMGNLQSGVLNIIPIIIGSGNSSCMTNLLKASQIRIASNRLYTLYLIGRSSVANNDLMLLFVESSFD